MESQLEKEIDEQPTTLARLLEEGRSQVLGAAQRIRERRPKWVCIAARGTSDNAARYAQYLFGAHNRLGVGLAVPSLFSLYAEPPALVDALTIGISQSGQSPDIVGVVEEAARQGGMTLAITNNPQSPLAAAADVSCLLSAGEEKSVAATKTYTNQLLMVAMLSAALEGKGLRWDALGAVPGAVRAAIASNKELGAIASTFADATQFLVLGRGYNYCTAFEIALKMKETSYVLAEPYSVADLLHGPVAMVDEGFPIVVVAPSGKASEQVPEVLDLLEKRRARTLVLSDRTDLLGRSKLALRLPRGVPEWLSPIVAIAPGQLFARALAVAKGLDPDNPRGLSKVTLTH